MSVDTMKAHSVYLTLTTRARRENRLAVKGDGALTMLRARSITVAGTALLASALSFSCAAPKPAESAGSGGASGGNAADEAKRGEAFLLAEEQAMDILAASDPRFAARRGVGPSDDSVQKSAVQALLAEDTDARVHQGALDVFSFAARARGLAAAEEKLKAAPAPRSLALERALWGRLLEAERARLAEEQDLPRGASELVRGMVETWGEGDTAAGAPAPSPEDIRARDQWAATRLADVTRSLAKAKLPSVELVELDDALDPLEHFAAPAEYPATAGGIAKLRIALGEVAPAPTRPRDWGEVQRALAAHVDARFGAGGAGGAEPGPLEDTLAAADKQLRALIKGIDPEHHLDDRAVARAAERLAFVSGRGDAVGSSKVRSLSPPSERKPLFGALRAVATAEGDAGTLAALEALDFEVTVAAWAVAVHARGLDADHAEAAAHAVLTLPPERQVRFLRLAVARPVVAIGTGVAVAELLRVAGAGGALRAAAGRWLAFGDAPLDVVEGSLSGGAP